MKNFVRFSQASFGYCVSPADGMIIPTADDKLFFVPRKREPKSKTEPNAEDKLWLKKYGIFDELSEKLQSNFGSLVQTLTIAQFVDSDAYARKISSSDKTRETKMLNPFIGINDMVEKVMMWILSGDNDTIVLFKEHIHLLDFPGKNSATQPERNELEE